VLLRYLENPYQQPSGMNSDTSNANPKPWVVIFVRYFSKHLSKRTKIVLLVLLVIIASVTGFALRSDYLKTSDLRSLEAALNSMPSPPASLEELSILHLHYPKQSYAYHANGDLYSNGHGPSYELCARFMLPSAGSGFGKHRLGKQCYQIDFYLNHGSADVVPL
jgi:hypothetical protein